MADTYPSELESLQALRKKVDSDPACHEPTKAAIDAAVKRRTGAGRSSGRSGRR
jgi:hypothetical protein